MPGFRDLLSWAGGRLGRSTDKGRAALASQNTELWNHPLVKQCLLQARLPKPNVETTFPDNEAAQRMMTRVIAQWEELGAEPYWSNMNIEQNKIAKIDKKALAAFHQVGTDWMATLAAYESRTGVAVPNGVCLELGAGAGKFTHALARRFERVIAVDISAAHLAVSQANLTKAGLTNVSTFVLRHPDDLAKLGKIDCFTGIAVFQHNPPPIQKMMLENAFASLNPGGCAIFQTQDWLEDYSYSNEAFLADMPDAVCDCHCLPKTVVIETMKAHGIELLDFLPDFFAEAYGSYTFFGRKVRQ